MSDVSATSNLSVADTWRNRPPGVGKKLWQFAAVYPTMAILIVTNYSNLVERITQAVDWGTLSKMLQPYGDVEDYRIWKRNHACHSPPPPPDAWQTTTLADRQVQLTLCPKTADLWIRIEGGNASDPLDDTYVWVGADKYLKSPRPSGSTASAH